MGKLLPRGQFEGRPRRKGVAREPNGRPSRKDPDDWAVYFIEAEGYGIYKIGYARTPVRRCNDLMVASPFPLRIAKLVRCISREDCLATERHFHIRFKARGFHERGEWYRLTEALIDQAVNEFFDALFQVKEQA